MSSQLFSALKSARSGSSNFLSLLAFTCLAVSMVLVLSSPQSAHSAEATLTWDPNPDPQVAGYKLYCGYSSQNYAYFINAGNKTSHTITGLEAGKSYFFAATAYDFYGNESGFSKEVVYTVPSNEGNDAKIWLEAEEGYLNAPMETAWSTKASAGAYISVPNGRGDLWNPSTDKGYAEYVFEAPVAGKYFVWGRVISNTSADDSFFVSMDYNGYLTWHTRRGGTETWVWDQVRDGTVSTPAVFQLEKGMHTLAIIQREDGTKLDRILITNDPNYRPTN